MERTTTDAPHSRTYFGYIPHDMTPAQAGALVFPYQLPRSAKHCAARYGVPGKPVLITVTVEELPDADA